MYSLSPNTLIEAAKLQSNFDDLSSGVGDLVSNSLETTRLLTVFDHVASGGVVTGDSYGVNKNASMTALIAIIGGKYVTCSAVSARVYTASKDTYIDVDNTGALTYTEVSNNAASPSLASNSLRLAIVVTGATTIASVASINQGQNNKALPVVSSVILSQWDSLGNVICNRSAHRLRRKVVAIDSTGNTTETVRATITVPALPFAATIRLQAYGVLYLTNGPPQWGAQTRIRLTNTSGTVLQRYEQLKSTAGGTEMYTPFYHDTVYDLPANTSQVFVFTIAGSQTVAVSNLSTGVGFQAEIERND